MPEYTLICPQHHTETVTQPMLYSTGVICAACGLDMWRKPQQVAVTWGGLKPSGGDLSPEIQQLIDTAPERRDAFEEEHEKHERNSQADRQETI